MELSIPPKNLAVPSAEPSVLKRGRRDIILVWLAAAAALGASLAFDLGEVVHKLGEEHESWQLDEILTTLLILSVVGFIYAWRRSRDLAGELTGRLEAEARVRTLAMHDPLTGIANRRRFNEVLVEAMRARRGDASTTTAVLMIDLDRFKPVNDLHGHAVGDQLLKMVADRIVEVVRDDELAARLGGDEFAVLLPRAKNEEAAARPARRILKALEAPFEIDGRLCQIGASIGIAATNVIDFQPQALLQQADAALYRAKREGRRQYRFFEQELDGQIRARAKLELELRQALADNEIAVHYQPLVELISGRVIGYEALARWAHPTLGDVPPAEFIPIAEDTGQIGKLTYTLLRRACLDALSWPAHTTLAVNLSPISLRDPAMPATILRILRETGLPPVRLEIEITENALVGDIDAARTALFALKAAGVFLALDDFGTGYSSLHHLRELPFDKLKIDRSFILSMDESEESRKIIDAIVGLGHNLGLVTTAEGIETPELAKRLTDMGCDLGQGYLYGRAVPASQTGRAEAPALCA